MFALWCYDSRLNVLGCDADTLVLVCFCLWFFTELFSCGVFGLLLVLIGVWVFIVLFCILLFSGLVLVITLVYYCWVLGVCWVE